MSIHFSDHTWPQLQEKIAGGALVLLPVGQTEEHGRHLPVSTDVVIAEEYARRAAEAIVEFPVLVLPAVWAGYSPREMQRWPGTFRIRLRVLHDYLYDICASLAAMGVKRLVLLDSHGQHADTLKNVTREIADEFRIYPAVVSPFALAYRTYNAHRQGGPGATCHGGEFETSLMLHLGQPVEMSQAVDTDRILYHSRFYNGDDPATSSVGGIYWSSWYIQRSETGLIGAPTAATAETGQACMEAAVSELVAFLREYHAHPQWK
jgi:creatinine amidohydrolase